MSEETIIDPRVEAFRAGDLIAYPTEAVYGLGCDPANESAVSELLALKQRPVEKGLILVAATYSQVFKYVADNTIPIDRRAEIFSSWPGPVTWLLPASVNAPSWITGGSDLIAIRVSAHPVVRELCELFDSALVSTSANLTGKQPAKSASEVTDQLGDKVLVLEGELGGSDKPTMIRNGLSGKIIRAN